MIMCVAHKNYFSSLSEISAILYQLKQPRRPSHELQIIFTFNAKQTAENFLVDNWKIVLLWLCETC